MIRYLVFNLLLNCYPCVPRRPSRWHGKLSSSSNSTLTAACGQATTVLENPWAAILYYEGSFQCGATILEDQLAITAAHCINGLHKDDFTLYYGRTFQPDSGIEDQGHRRFGGQTGILAWRIHPRYNVFDKFEGKDIALLKLKIKIQFNDFVRPIKVVPTHHKYDIMYDRARIVNLAGFGQTKGPLDSTNPDDWPDQMQLVEQKIVPEQRCNRGNDTFHFGPPQDGLCTRLKCEPNERQGIQAKFKQICPGDSGSGIVQHFVEDNTFYLLAVVSYTVAHGIRECGLSKKPALSIKTRDHRDFIYEDFFPYKRSKQATETDEPPIVKKDVELDPNIPFEPAPGQRCAGTNYNGRRCCTPEAPCNEGEGDCNGPLDRGVNDGHTGCKGDLVCGLNNCKQFGHYYHPKDDCCERATGPFIQTPKIDVFGNDGWGIWGEWSACSRRCGGGTWTRDRFCAGDSCDHLQQTQTSLCNVKPC